MESSHGHSERTVVDNGVFSRRYSKHRVDGEGAISRQDSEQIVRDSCAHKPQSVWWSGEATSEFSMTE